MPTVALLLLELRAEQDLRVLSLGRRCVVFWYQHHPHYHPDNDDYDDYDSNVGNDYIQGYMAITTSRFNKAMNNVDFYGNHLLIKYSKVHGHHLLGK